MASELPTVDTPPERIKARARSLRPPAASHCNTPARTTARPLRTHLLERPSGHPRLGVQGARMTCKPDSVTTSRRPTTIPLGPSSRTGSSGQPGSLGREDPGANPARSLFGLAPGGACHAADVTAGAVGSYPTVSPLPRAEARSGLISVALSLGLPRAGVTRRHFSLESGLSSRVLRPPRPSSHPRTPRL
jgi:hypothetical protein